MEQLPMFCWTQVLTYLSHVNVINLCMVCKSLKAIASQDIIWKKFYKCDFPVTIFSHREGISQITWKERYAQLKRRGIGRVKTHVDLLVMGSTGSGKSSVSGHLMYKCGGLDKRTKEKFATMRPESVYSWIAEQLKRDRDNGIRIKIDCWVFESNIHQITILEDTFGHPDFIKNLCTGSSQADAALLVISAPQGEYDKGIATTKQYSFLAYNLGIRKLLVVVNKMDDAFVNWAQPRFAQIVSETSTMLTEVGYNVEDIWFVPISATTGDNFTEKSNNLLWYKGPTLVEAFDELAPRRDTYPLRFIVKDVWKVGGIGTVITGKVETGKLKSKMQIKFSPSNLTAVVHGIEVRDTVVQEALPGEEAAVSVRKFSVQLVKRGMIIGDATSEPPQQVASFIALIVVTNHHDEICPGYTPVFECKATATKLPCKFERIESRTDMTGDNLELNPASIKVGHIAVVEIRPKQPIFLELFCECPALGRFTISEMGRTVAFGVVKN